MYGPSVFERFTERARRVAVLAQEEARKLNHGYIGTEHILLALLQEEEGIAARALTTHGAQLAALRDSVKEIIGVGASPSSGHIPFTPRAKKVLELSLREAIHLGHNYIGTEHVLLGLIREGEGVASQMLQRVGMNPDDLRRTVAELLGVDPAKAATPPPHRRSRPFSCPHPDEALEITQAVGLRSVRCRHCGRLVGVLPDTA